MPTKDDKGRTTEAIAQDFTVNGHINNLPVKGKWFCKLCRKYDILTPRAHLINHHKTDSKAMERKSSKSIVKELFVMSS